MLPPPKDVSVFITHEVRSTQHSSDRARAGAVAGLVDAGVANRHDRDRDSRGSAARVSRVERPVGNITIGSPLLWPNSEFNMAEREINRNLAGTVTLNVVWEGRIPRALYRPEVYDSMLRFQKAIERNHGAVATLSLADYIPYTGLILRGGNPKWLPIDLTGHDVGAYLFWTRTGHSLENFGQIIEPNGTNGDVVLWYKDLRASTVDGAMAQAERAIAEVQTKPSPVYRIRLATGSVALQYALDHVVRAADLKILLYLLATIFVMCVLTYHSGVAAAMLLVPLLFAQFATDSVMYLRGVGLDVNTLPVVAVGLGVGIDYGILSAEPHLRGVPGRCRRRRAGRGDARGFHHGRSDFLRRLHHGAGRAALVLPVRAALPGRDGSDAGTGDGVQRAACDERVAAGDGARSPQIPGPRKTDGTQGLSG